MAKFSWKQDRIVNLKISHRETAKDGFGMYENAKGGKVNEKGNDKKGMILAKLFSPDIKWNLASDFIQISISIWNVYYNNRRGNA